MVLYCAWFSHLKMFIELIGNGLLTISGLIFLFTKSPALGVRSNQSVFLVNKLTWLIPTHASLLDCSLT